MIILNRKHIRPIGTNVHSIKSLITFTPSVVNPIITSINEVNGKKMYNVKRDIKLLLGQVRLDNLNIESLKEYFNTHMNSEVINKLRSQCTDEQLLNFCKSRYIQRPSELNAYFRYLENNFDSETRVLMEQIHKVNTSDDQGSDDNKPGQE